MTTITILFRALIGLGVAALPAALPALAAPERLPELYRQLADPANKDWARVESDIQREWTKSGSAVMDLLLKRGQEAADAGDLEAALEHLTALTDHAPDFAEGFSTRASVYFMLGQTGPAVADLARTLALDGHHYDAMVGLAVIEEQLGRDAEALKAYRAALAIHPHQKESLEAVERLEQKTAGTAL